MRKNISIEEQLVLEREDDGKRSMAIEENIASVLWSEINAYKKSVPSLLKRLDYLKQGLESEPVEKLLEEQGKLQEELNVFSRVLEKYSAQEGLPAYEGLICRDFCHTFRWRLANFSAFEYLLRDLRGSTLDENKRSEMLWFLQSIVIRLIEEVKELGDFSLDIQKKTSISSLLSDVFIRCANLTVDIDSHEFEHFFISCNSAVFRSIIKEILENYRKYGTDGKISFSLVNGALKISIINKKKEKEAHDYSSSSWLKIVQEYLEMIGGVFESDYASDECTTNVFIPASKE